MDYIILDTNIYFKNWFLASANFTFLSNYLENTGAILLSSKIVEEEVQNKYETEFDKATASLKSALSQLDSLLPEASQMSSQDYNYNFHRILHQKFNNITEVEYSKIDNLVVVSRAIKRITPFKENDKGFRDTLIWLSLLEFLKNSSIEGDVVFITENYTDYFNRESKQFKPDLSNDIEVYGLRCKINPFVSLNEFINTLNKDEYESPSMVEQIEELVYQSEAEIEDDIELFINRLSPVDVQELFSLKIHYPFISSFVDFKIEIYEGLEKMRISHHKKIVDKQYYINCDVELRVCVFSFAVSFHEYDRNKGIIDRRFSNLFFSDDMVYLEKIVRPSFSINFIAHLDAQVINGLEVTSAIFTVRRDLK